MFLTLIACLFALRAPAQNPVPHWKAQGVTLLYDSQPYRNAGVNIPDLFARFLAGDEASALRSLDSAKAAGVSHVRFMGCQYFAKDMRRFDTDREAWIRAFRRLVRAAEARNMALIPSLLWHIQMPSDYVRLTEKREEGLADLTRPESASNRFALRYVTEMVSLFCDSPAILCWEIGNEFNLETDFSTRFRARPPQHALTSDQLRDFYIQIAKHIKKIAPNALVTTGNADMRPAAWHLREERLKHNKEARPLDYDMNWTKDNFEQYVEILRFYHPDPIDIISVHHYPFGNEVPGWLTGDDSKAQMFEWTERAAKRIGKPLYIGEYNQKVFEGGKETPLRWAGDFLRRFEASEAPMASIWSWEYDPDNPSQSPYSLWSHRTPQMIRALAETNRRLSEKGFHAPKIAKESR